MSTLTEIKASTAGSLIEKILHEIGLGPEFGSMSPLRLTLIENNRS